MFLQCVILTAIFVFAESKESKEKGSVINFHLGFDNRVPIAVHDARVNSEVFLDGRRYDGKGNSSQETKINLKEDVVPEKMLTDELADPEGRRHSGRHALRIKNNHPVKIQITENLRIRGGNITDTLNFPYVAAVIINGRLWCAGAIVDENWVLTAAHCLNYVLHISPLKTLSKYVKVRVGSHKPHEGGTVIDVIGAVRHPKFEEEPVPHADVALLKLTTNLVFSNYVNLIKIYEGRVEPYAQSFVVVTGWGATRGSETAFRDPTSDLLSARLKVRSHQYCIDAYQLVNGFMFTKDFFCASLRKGTRDACLFDAGAPAILKNRLMGVMSFGPERCGSENQPAVFIKAFYFRDFVKTTIASYKTTADLIEAMRDVDPENVKPHVLEVEEEPEFEAVVVQPTELPVEDDKYKR